MSTSDIKKVYIAGKVSGELIADCTIKFGAAQKDIESLGYQVINPLAVVNDWHTPWQKAMKICIASLMSCDAIVLLPCWQDSTGAKIERQLAEDLDMPIYNYSKFGLIVLKNNL